MKTLFVAAGPIQFASSRFRCYWPAEHMNADVVEFNKAINKPFPDDYDNIIYQKHGNTGAQKELLKMGKQVWLDQCDPMWWFSPDAMRNIADHSTGAVFSNEELRLNFVEWYDNPQYPTYTIADRIKLSHFPKQREHQEVDPVRFIWHGAAVNQISLLGAWSNLCRLKANGYNISLTEYSDNPNMHVRFGPEVPVYTAVYNVEQENEVFASHDIALLPPYPGPWGEVKSNNKAVQSWASGLPVVDGFEYEEMEKMVVDVDWRKHKANIGLDKVNSEYSIKQSAAEWEDILDAS